MDPFSLLALATAAGFVFKKLSGTPDKEQEERREFVFSKDLVARLDPDYTTDYDIDTVEVLPEYRLVKSLVEHRFPVIFVTGGAGTGKSTLIRWLQKQFAGTVLLGAPTGMAAVNVGGRTLHSLCQLPPGWVRQSDIKVAPSRRDIQEAQLLIIDEISMVTANLLDGVSAFLRANRKVDRPFGGLPVIMVGDMFQLPPIIPSGLQRHFEQHYGTPKFYNARCLQETTYYGVELTRTYRQSEQTFVDILTRLREGVDLPEVLEQLNNGCTISRRSPVGAVYLSPRRVEVERRNRNALDQLPGRPKIYQGQVNGAFKKDRLPAPATLELKVGAQVVFTHTDDNGRWVAGSVGRIQRMLDDKVFVELYANEKYVDVGRITWPEYRYDWDQRSGRMVRTQTGSYRQLPLNHGWANTIHQSQGKTIEKVHLDLGSGAFETGQTYVALSRCRSLKSLSLARPLEENDVLVDFESKHFYENLRAIIQRLPARQLLQQLQQSPD